MRRKLSQIIPLALIFLVIGIFIGIFLTSLNLPTTTTTTSTVTTTSSVATTIPPTTTTIIIKTTTTSIEKYCMKNGTDKKLSLTEAKQIAMNSECSKGKLTETHVCNEITGTWWINLNIESPPICSPACVINVLTKQAEINWRCLGAQ